MFKLPFVPGSLFTSKRTTCLLHYRFNMIPLKLRGGKCRQGGQTLGDGLVKKGSEAIGFGKARVGAPKTLAMVC